MTEKRRQMMRQGHCMHLVIPRTPLRKREDVHRPWLEYSRLCTLVLIAKTLGYGFASCEYQGEGFCVFVRVVLGVMFWEECGRKVLSRVLGLNLECGRV